MYYKDLGRLLTTFVLPLGSLLSSCNGKRLAATAFFLFLKKYALFVSLILPLSAHAVPILSVDTDPGTAGVQSSLSVEAGTSFNVDVFISGVTPLGLNAFDFNLLFDPSKLAATSIVDGGFMAPPFLELVNSVAGGSAQFAELTLGPIGAIGEGVLATISFDALAAGISNLSFGPVILSEPFGIPMPVGALLGASITVTDSSAIPLPATSLLLFLGLVGLRLSRKTAVAASA